MSAILLVSLFVCFYKLLIKISIFKYKKPFKITFLKVFHLNLKSLLLIPCVFVLWVSFFPISSSKFPTQYRFFNVCFSVSFHAFLIIIRVHFSSLASILDIKNRLHSSSETFIFRRLPKTRWGIHCFDKNIWKTWGVLFNFQTKGWSDSFLCIG